MDEEVFAEAAGISYELAATVWPFMLDTLNEFEIKTGPRIAAFIGQTAHESNGYRSLREDTYYLRPEDLLRVFPSYFGDGKANPLEYVRSSKKLANYVYANKGGNGPPESGDGWRFRAGGYIGITFRNGYRWMAELLDVPLEDEPELIESHEVAARTGGAYWANTQWKGTTLNDYADAWNINAISGLINRGSPFKTAEGAKKRLAGSERALRVIRKAVP